MRPSLGPGPEERRRRRREEERGRGGRGRRARREAGQEILRERGGTQRERRSEERGGALTLTLTLTRNGARKLKGHKKCWAARVQIHQTTHCHGNRHVPNNSMKNLLLAVSRQAM